MQTGTNPAQIEVPFSVATQRLFRNAIIEANELGSMTIDTQHLLLALLREGGNARTILQEARLSPDYIRQQLMRAMGVKDPRLVTAGVHHGTGTPSTVKSPTVDQFCRDITEIARQGRLDPVIGREKEIERVIQILGRRAKNNPILIGEPGVGKTALAEGLALRIIHQDVPEILLGKRVVSLDVGLLVAGTTMRGDFEERLKKIMDEVRESGNFILVIDEVHTIVGAGGVDFKNTVIVMTSNIGSNIIVKGGVGLGFEFEGDSSEAVYNRIRALVNEELKNHYRPEFLNRIDDIIVFQQLKKGEIVEIASILLAELQARVAEKGISLEISDSVKDLVAEEGYNPSYGARPLRRAIMTLLEDVLAEYLLSESVEAGETITMDLNADGKVFVIKGTVPANI